MKSFCYKKSLYINASGYARWLIFIIVVILTALIEGCEKKNVVLNENTLQFSEFPSEDTLQFNNMCEYIGGVSEIIHIVDSTLVIYSSSSTKYFLQNYSLKTGQFSEGYANIGKGPGEAIGVISFGLRGNKVWLYDITLKKVLVADVDKILSNESMNLFKEYDVENQYYMVDFKDSSHFFSVGYDFSDFKIQEVDLNTGKEIEEYGKITDIPEDLSLSQYKSAYETFIAVKPTGDKIVLPYRYSDLIEIYDMETDKSLTIHGPDKFDVIYEIIGNQATSKSGEARYTFISWNVTNNYIYLAYSGLVEGEENYYLGNSIFVYDWEGNPVRKLLFDTLIYGFAVSDDDKKIYAYDMNSGWLIEAKL